MDRIEEIARAIYERSPMIQFWDRPGGPPGNGEVPWDRLDEPYREVARTQARAAYEVMTSSDGEVAELRAFKARVMAAVQFDEPVSRAEIDAAVRDDIIGGLSLRACAAKHGLTFGQARGAAKRAALAQGGSLDGQS